MVTSTTERRKHGYLSGGGLYACCRCKLAPWYRLRNRTRSHCMNIICIQVGYMAGAGISWLASINDYMEPTDVGGPATPRLALYLLRPPIPPSTLALSLNALLMATAYNLWRPLFERHQSKLLTWGFNISLWIGVVIAIGDSFLGMVERVLLLPSSSVARRTVHSHFSNDEGQN